VTAAALEELIERETVLVAALDAGDIELIESATRDMTGAIVAVASKADWHEQADLREHVTQALRLAEAAGGRINYLADDNRRRIERLHTLSGRPRTEAYARSGRLARYQV
jgi:hypothetical protein